MKKSRRLITVFLAVALFITFLAPMLPVANAATISKSTFETRVQEFISDSRWKNGITWADAQKPKLSSYSSIGCCAYAADFVAYVYGSTKYAWNTSDFTKFTDLNDIRAGDIIHTSNHWFVVISRTGNNFYTAEGNFDDKTRITTSGWGIKNGKIYNLKASDGARTFEYGFHYNFSDVSYTLNYNTNGGSGSYSAATVGYGGSFTIPATAPTRDGYTFTGWTVYRHGDGTWYSAGNGWNTAAQLAANGYSAKLYTPGTTYSLDTSWLNGCTDNTQYTFYAQWEINTYTVNYSANGGSGAPGSQTKTYGTALTLSSTQPTRTGYTFLGWATSSTATSATYQPGASFATNANTTLYAVWKENTYTVSYDLNGGSGTVASQTKYYSTPLELSGALPGRVGYTFMGWATSPTAASAAYQPWSSFTTNADTTLYAVWGANPHVIYYNANGGSGAPDAVIADYGTSVPVSTTVPVNDGWKFVGWCTNPDRNLGVLYLSGESITVTGDMTLYAIWDRDLPIPQVSKLENTASGVKVTWGAVDGAEKYRLFVKTSTGWATVGTTTGTSLTYTGAKSGYTYTFTVRCLNAAGTAFTSSYNSTGWKQTYVAQPSISKLENTASGIKVTWGAVNGAGKYRLFVKTSSGWATVGTTTGTSLTYTGAKSGYTYTFTVRALNSAGTAFVSSYNSSGWKQTYVAQPSISKLENTASGIKITWNAVSGAGLYRVYVKTSTGWSAIGTTGGTSLTYTGAKSGYTYTFTVRALNSAGTAFVSSYNATGWKQTYIARPSITKLTNTTSGIKLTWGAVSGAAKYRVFVKTSSGWKAIGTTTGTSLTWTGAASGVTYTFTVRCLNSAGTAYTSAYNATGWRVKRT